MITTWRLISSGERRVLYLANREHVSRFLLIASGVLTFVFLLIALLWPRTQQAVVRVFLPKKTRTIVIPEMQVETPPAAKMQNAPDQLTVQEVKTRPATEQEKQEALAPPPLRRPEPLDPNAGTVGRERARQATAELASTSLDRSLDDLAGALSTGTTVEPSRNRRQRGVRSGRAENVLASVDPGAAGGSVPTDAGTPVQGTRVALGTLETPTADEVEPATESAGSGAAPGVYRSNASLLAVIQRYAAGIQYCYSSELNKAPTLRGKLVVALTVAASGQVIDAAVVSRSISSPRLEACALSQIREWKFPAIATGVTSFQAPFVFTPPK